MAPVVYSAFICVEMISLKLSRLFLIQLQSTFVNISQHSINMQQHAATLSSMTYQYSFTYLKTCLSLSAASTQSTKAIPSTQLSQKYGSFFDLCQQYQHQSTQHQHVATYSNTVITTASVVSKPVSLCLRCQHCSSYKNMQVFSIHSTLLTQLNLYLISGLS